MRNNFFLAGIFCLMFIGQVFALAVETPLTDAAQEARAKALFHEIRCVVCQSEAVADSPAQVAEDMRRMIREHIAAGESDTAIKAYLVAQYGDFILMKPPLNHITWLLWFGPLLLLAAGAMLMRRYFRAGRNI